jgi:hypothetical protein
MLEKVYATDSEYLNECDFISTLYFHCDSSTGFN